MTLHHPDGRTVDVKDTRVPRLIKAGWTRTATTTPDPDDANPGDVSSDVPDTGDVPEPEEHTNG